MTTEQEVVDMIEEATGEQVVVREQPAWQPPASRPRRPSFRTVPAGSTVSVPVEGGYVGERTEESGVVFEAEGHEGLFIPMSMVGDALAKLKEMSKRRRGR